MEEVFSQIPDALKGINQALVLLGFFFFFLILVELVFDFLSKNPNRNFKQSFVDFGVYVGHEIAGRLGGALVFLATLSFASNFRVFQLPLNLTTWIAGLVLADFLYYWSHRLEHRCRLFWCWHNVHHSSSDYNGTTALRLGWLEPFVSWYLLVPMVLIGFDVFQVLLLFQILLTYQTWIHTQKIGKLGWFEKIFNSPSSHRVHHGSNREYLDKNYGALLILWDRMFGTYAPETTLVKYGLTTDIGTNNPITVNLKVPLDTLQGLWRVRGLSNKVRWLFSGPEWQPARDSPQEPSCARSGSRLLRASLSDSSKV